MKYKINRDREPLTDGELSSARNFNSIFKGYNAMKIPFYRRGRFLTSGSAIIVAVAVAFIVLFDDKIETPEARDNELSITAREKPTMTIDPDTMYFNSHTSRTFTIRNLPKGATVKGTFMGYDFNFKDSTITLQPWIIYRDSDVIKRDKGYSRLASGEKTTNGEYYISEVRIKIFDSNGIQIDSIVRNCFIKPEPYTRTRNVNRWPLYPRDTVQLNKIRKPEQ